MKTALTIAGSDCSGGAGIQADLKTFAAHNVYGMSIITAVTAQNTTGVISVEAVSPKIIGHQFKAVFEDIFPQGVKIGMLWGADTIKAVAEGLEFYKPQNVVIDPVLYAKDGTALTDESRMDYLIENVYSKADILTPNIPEAERISHIKINSEAHIEMACKAICDLGIRAVLIKGGHFRGEPTDILYDGKSFYRFKAKRIDTKNTHGTGCTLSSAIAANLALGCDIPTAAAKAKEYINGAILNSLDLGRGFGPLNHNWRIFEGEKDVK